MTDSIDSQTKGIICKVYSYFAKATKDVNSVEYSPGINIIKHVAKMTGLTEEQVTQIISEQEQTPSDES